jgi:hypothetical protein
MWTTRMRLNKDRIERARVISADNLERGRCARKIFLDGTPAVEKMFSITAKLGLFVGQDDGEGMW